MIPWLTISLIALAAIFKAIADTLDDHFDISIFKRKNPKWWKPDVSWQYVGYLPFTKYHPDAWHLSMSGMVISFALAIIFHEKVFTWYFELILAGFIYNLVFNLFYNKILRKT